MGIEHPDSHATLDLLPITPFQIVERSLIIYALTLGRLCSKRVRVWFVARLAFWDNETVGRPKAQAQWWNYILSECSTGRCFQYHSLQNRIIIEVALSYAWLTLAHVVGYPISNGDVQKTEGGPFCWLIFGFFAWTCSKSQGCLQQGRYQPRIILPTTKVGNMLCVRGIQNQQNQCALRNLMW